MNYVFSNYIPVETGARYICCHIQGFNILRLYFVKNYRYVSIGYLIGDGEFYKDY